MPDNVADVVTDVVLGDLFVAEGEENGFLKVKLPDGRQGFVRLEECLALED